jgi:hypothetical protein
MIDYKYPTHSLGGNSHRERWSRTQWKLLREERGRKFESIIGGKHQKHKLNIYSHRESGFKNPTILAIAFEVKDIWSQRLKNQMIEEVRELKKSKI